MKDLGELIVLAKDFCWDLFFAYNQALVIQAISHIPARSSIAPSDLRNMTFLGAVDSLMPSHPPIVVAKKRLHNPRVE